MKMGMITTELLEKVKSLTDTDKLQLVDSILTQLDKPDPELDRIGADESGKRWQAYKTGTLETVAYEQVMDKYRIK